LPTKKPDGASCTLASECASGICAVRVPGGPTVCIGN
jgi:hypothetical protein